MVKLIVIARCIPEDVYLRSLESPLNLQLVGEKKFPVVVREPEDWPIGRLANEIKARYEGLYKRQFGQVKYLKDNDDDCDLDPDLTVADLLVDEGKAARDGSDQKKIIKLIQEQGRAVRQGSVIPDLTQVHYQPRTLPPIPRFPGTERRGTEDRQIDDRPTKRRRLDQIEEESDQIVHSIERDALNGDLRSAEAVIEPKIESPELTSTWINTGPATVDELELLPEAPADFRARPRRRQDHGIEIRESSVVQHEESRERGTDAEHLRHGYNNGHSLEQPSLSHTHPPITPSNARETARTPSGQVVTMLNSMKSQSPIVRQLTSTSASRFRKPAKNVYDYPESDIDDTQMSPRSKASRTKITPRLVRTPNSITRPERVNGTPQRLSRHASVIQESPNSRRVAGRKSVEAHQNEERQQANLPSEEQLQPDTEVSHRRPEQIEEKQPKENDPSRAQQPRASRVSDASSALHSDETWSIHEDGTRRKKVPGSRSQRKLSGDASTSRSSSAASSAKSASDIQRGTAGKLKRKRIAPTRPDDRQSRSEVSELDSPGMQLSETLRRSSPASRPSKDASQMTSETVTRSTRTSEQAQQVGQAEDVEMEDIERPPDSISESEEEIPPAPAPKRPKTKSVQSPSLKSENLRCFTCWRKKALCDNKQPKCEKCERNKKNCLGYAMTRDAFEKLKAERQAERESKTPSRKKSASKKAKADTEDMVSNSVISNAGAEEESTQPQKANTTKMDQTQNKPSKSIPDGKGGEHVASAKAVSPTSADGNSRLGKEQSMLKSTQSGSGKSATKLQSTSESSKQPSTTNNLKTTSKAQDQNIDMKETTKTFGERQADLSKRVAAKSAKDKTSANHAQAKTIKAKSSDLPNDVQMSAVLETGRQGLPAALKETPSMPKEKSSTRERSIETRVTKSGKVLPPGMSEEEYEALVGSRAHLTDQQRLDQKLRNKKLEKKLESTPSVVQEPSRQELTERTKKSTPSVKSTQPISSTQSVTKTQSKPPPSTQAARTPASIKSDTPASTAPIPAKTKPAPPSSTQPSTATKLKAEVASADKGIKIKSPNPPFQPHQPQPKTTTQTTTSITAAPSSLTESRTLKDIRAVLTSQSRSGSGASTPQPARTTAARLAEIRRGVGVGSARKKITSLSDDDDDEDDEDDDEDDSDEEDEQGHRQDAKGVSAKSVAKSNVVVRKRTPSDSGSGSESESGNDTGSASGASEEGNSGSKSASEDGSESEDDDEDDDDE